MSELVLVTGASGYIATHAVQQLIKAGYRVRGTVRSLANEKKIKPIRDLGEGGSLELVEADLLNEETWKGAVAGCTYVLHIASPFPSADPSDENELIKPAVDGTLNVLKACRESKTVKRVVLTSSAAAICGNLGANRLDPPFTEADWTDTTAKVAAYAKSKTLAEKAAWDYVKDLPEDEKFELATINPALVLGPALCGATGTTMELMQRVMERQMPMVPAINFGITDVRDVAAAHIVAMTLPEAAGNRHILSNKNMWFKEIAEILKKEFKAQGYNPPTTKAPYPVLWFVGRVDKGVKMLLPNVGKVTKLDNTRLREVLKIEPIEVEKTIIDMAYSMIDSGKIKKSSKYKAGKENANGTSEEKSETKDDAADTKNEAAVVTNGDAKAVTNGEAKVESNGDAAAVSNGDAKVESSGDAKVETSDDAKVESSGETKVEINGDAKAETSGDVPTEGKKEEPVAIACL